MAAIPLISPKLPIPESGSLAGFPEMKLPHILLLGLVIFLPNEIARIC
jgi:hypothetical protein